MVYDIKACGERIRKLRMASGLTQEKTAESLNVDRSFYSRIESGKSGCSVDLFIELSSIFGVSLDYLILGKYSDVVLEGQERSCLKADIEKLAVCLEQLRVQL